MEEQELLSLLSERGRLIYEKGKGRSEKQNSE